MPGWTQIHALQSWCVEIGTGPRLAPGGRKKISFGQAGHRILSAGGRGKICAAQHRPYIRRRRCAQGATVGSEYGGQRTGFERRRPWSRLGQMARLRFLHGRTRLGASAGLLGRAQTSRSNHGHQPAKACSKTFFKELQVFPSAQRTTFVQQLADKSTGSAANCTTRI